MLGCPHRSGTTRTAAGLVPTRTASRRPCIHLHPPTPPSSPMGREELAPRRCWGPPMCNGFQEAMSYPHYTRKPNAVWDAKPYIQAHNPAPMLGVTQSKPGRDCPLTWKQPPTQTTTPKAHRHRQALESSRTIPTVPLECQGSHAHACRNTNGRLCIRSRIHPSDTHSDRGHRSAQSQLLGLDSQQSGMATSRHNSPRSPQPRTERHPALRRR